MTAYPSHTPCDYRSGLSVVLTVGLGIVCWWACAYVGYDIGLAVGWPEGGVVFGAFGIPILLILVNGWHS